MTKKQQSQAARALKGNPGIGRDKLSRIVGCTTHQAQKWLDANRGPSPSRRSPAKPADAPETTDGLVLHNDNVYCTKPQDRAKGLIFSLPKGRGFPVAELAKQWNMNPETVRKHARKWDALRYVERTPGEIVTCVCHPDTAQKYKG